MLPVFQLLGTNYREKQIISHFSKEDKTYDVFSRINFVYPEATASVEGLRYELVAFLKSIERGESSAYSYIEEEVSGAVAGVVEDFYRRKDTTEI